MHFSKNMTFTHRQQSSKKEPKDRSVESFFATLKKEQIFKRKYDTMEEVQRDVFEYIELFYNRKRMHSHLGYMSPVEYRLKQMELSA